MDVSEDPFNLYPIINRKTPSAPTVRKVKKLSINKVTKKAAARVIAIRNKATLVHKSGREEGGEEAIVGINKTLKRGRKPKQSVSMIKVSAELRKEDGPTDSEIEACNKLVLKKKAEDEAVALWELGNHMGLLSSEDWEKILDQFVVWELREKLIEDGSGSAGIKETTRVDNADN